MMLTFNISQSVDHVDCSINRLSYVVNVSLKRLIETFVTLYVLGFWLEPCLETVCNNDNKEGFSQPLNVQIHHSMSW